MKRVKKWASRVWRFIRWTVFVIVVAGAATLIAVANRLDPNDFKPQIEAELSKAARREVRINGRLDWTLFSLAPGIEVNGISVKNTKWGAHENFLTADTAKALISLRRAIFEQKIAIDKIVIIEPKVNLEISSNGLENWKFGRHSKTINISPAPASNSFIKISIEDVEIINANATYEDHRTGSDAKIAAPNITFTAPPGKPMNLAFTIIHNGISYFGEVEGTPAADDMIIDGNLHFNNARLAFIGKIKDYYGEKQLFTAALKLHSPNIQKTLKGIAKTEITYPITIGADIVSTGGFISVPNLSLKYANLDMTGSAEANLAGAKPEIKASLAAPLFDIPTLFFPKWEAAYRYRVLHDLEREDEDEYVPDPKAFRNVPLPVAELNLANANIKINIGKLKAMPDMELDNLSISAALNNGQAAVSPIIFDMAGGKARIAVIGNNAGGTFNGDVSIKADNVDVGKIIDSTGYINVFSGGTAKAEIALHGSGNNLAEFMGKLNGYIKGWTTSKATGYRIEKIFMSEDVVATVFRAVLGRTKRAENSTINCVVANISIKDGIARTNRGLAIQTDAANMVVDGSVNFASETMDISIITMVKEGLRVNSSLTDYIKISGAMASPDITLSQNGVVGNIAKTSLATALLGLATGGISIAVAGVGYLTQTWLTNISEDPDPCITALDGTANPRPEEAFTEQMTLREAMNEKVGAETERLDDITSSRIDRAKEKAKR